MDAVTEEARKLDEEEEEDIIAVSCVAFVDVDGVANASRANIGRVGRIEGTAARYSSTVSWTRDDPRWPQIDAVLKSGCWIGRVRSGRI